MTALLLHDLLIVQLAVSDGATVNVTTPSINPAEKFEPDAINVLINGLWVVSLTTSLVVALAAVLVKQWLHRYISFPSGTPGLRSHVRQFRFMGLEKWRVRIIVGMLPIIMHISLMLFFAGLALFYVPLRASLAWTVGTIAVLVCVLYLVSNTLPIIFPQCPYQTPLTDFIHRVCQIVPFGVQSIRHYCFATYRSIRKLAVPSRQQSSMASDHLQSKLKSLTQIESDTVRDAHATLCVDALDWLYQMSSNPTVHTLVLHSMSGLPAASRSYAVTKWSDATNMQIRHHQLLQQASQIPGQPWVLERLCRSILFLPMGIEGVSIEDVFIEKSDDWDPRIEAAIWLSAYELSFHTHSIDIFISHDDNSIDFFIRHSEVLMHPLIWEGIIRLVLNQFRRHKHSGVNGFSLAQVLSLVIVPPLATGPSASLMTGPQVIWMRLQSRFWDTILETRLLAPYDSALHAPISSYHRTLIAAGKLALFNIRQYRDVIDDFTIAQHQHLELLTCVVRLITRPTKEPNTRFWMPYLHNYLLVDFDLLISVLEEFRDVSVSSSLPLWLDHIRSFYVQSSRLPEFQFPGLDCFLHSWAGFYDCVQYDSEFSYYQVSHLETPINVMGNALFRGHEEAYQLFISRGWIGIIFTDWVICGEIYGDLCWVITGYARGLFNMTSNSSCREFCEYLHQPQNLLLAFMLMVEPRATAARQWNFSYPLDDPVVQLAKICPTHTSWSDCDTALKAILAWAQSPNAELSLFPWPHSLQSLETTEAFRKYPLVEWIARRFSSQAMPENLEAALSVLHEVLENAVHVSLITLGCGGVLY